MRILLACEFYSPSVGGVQEVMKQLAERFVQRGHQVTVATTSLADRDFESLNGVQIVGFDIAGNLVRGMSGELDRYREFVRTFPCDALMVKAAQQWTFDALWPVLEQISCRKVFIPCGFSGLYEPAFKSYFEQLPAILRQWDHLIFYAEHYRDVDFARKHGLSRFSILPNGASEVEFSVLPDPDFRQRHGIPAHSFVILTVGSLNGMKGHREVAEAFALLRLPEGRHATLLLNGNEMPKPRVQATPVPAPAPVPSPAIRAHAAEQDHERPVLLARIIRVYRNEGMDGIRNRLGIYFAQPLSACVKVVRITAKAVASLKRHGVVQTAVKAHQALYARTQHMTIWKRVPERWLPSHTYSIAQWLATANRIAPGRKRAVHTNFPRNELVQAYLTADLFVFASNIEYSPLVLYEAAAAGTPFLTVPVGNAEEIARWTGAGVICPAEKDERGYTRVEPAALARNIEALAGDAERLIQLGETGRQRWLNNFTWKVISLRYQDILAGDAKPCDTLLLNKKE